MNDKSESWDVFEDTYDNMIEKIVKFCFTPRTITEVIKEFNIAEAAIKFVFKKLVENEVLEITAQNLDRQDMYRAIEARSWITRDVSSDESTKRERLWNKILVLGDSGVGKTALLLRFVDKVNEHDTKNFGFRVHRMTFEYENQTYFVVILESTGKVWKKFWKGQCENAGGVFFIFDTTNPKTLENIDYWADILPSPEERVPLIIIENKMDLESQIDKSLVELYVNKYGAEYIRLSAKSDDNSLETALQRMVLSNLTRNISNRQNQDSSRR